MRDAQSERDARMRVRGGRMFLVSPSFGRKIVKERKRKGKEKKERKKRKERRREEGMMAGDGQRRPELAGVGRRRRPRLQAQVIKWGASIVHFRFLEF